MPLRPGRRRREQLAVLQADVELQRVDGDALVGPGRRVVGEAALELVPRLDDLDREAVLDHRLAAFDLADGCAAAKDRDEDGGERTDTERVMTFLRDVAPDQAGVGRVGRQLDVAGELGDRFVRLGRFW
jgi:hypothetical protein